MNSGVRSLISWALTLEICSPNSCTVQKGKGLLPALKTEWHEAVEGEGLREEHMLGSGEALDHESLTLIMVP